MRFGIPSYRRHDSQPTAQLLSTFGVPREDIIISTQTEEDYCAYRSRWESLANIVFHPGRCVSDNRNTILEHLFPGDEVVMLDDDISAFRALTKGGRLIDIDGTMFLSTCRRAFDLCAEHRADIWGMYPIENAFYMKQRISADRLLIGTTMGIVVKDGLRFDNSIKVKEDFEYCCKVMASGRHTLRLDYLAAHAKHRTNAGGCHDDWGGNCDAAKKLLLMYPDLVKENPRRPGEILKK